jgi:hypothetical protein
MGDLGLAGFMSSAERLREPSAERRDFIRRKSKVLFFENAVIQNSEEIGDKRAPILR